MLLVSIQFMKKFFLYFDWQYIINLYIMHKDASQFLGDAVTLLNLLPIQLRNEHGVNQQDEGNHILPGPDLE